MTVGFVAQASVKCVLPIVQSLRLFTVAQGSKAKLGEALETYRQSLTMMERLAAQDPTNTIWQYDLAIGHNRIGLVLMDRIRIGKTRYAGKCRRRKVGGF